MVLEVGYVGLAAASKLIQWPQNLNNQQKIFGDFLIRSRKLQAFQAKQRSAAGVPFPAGNTIRGGSSGYLRPQPSRALGATTVSQGVPVGWTRHLRRSFDATTVDRTHLHQVMPPAGRILDTYIRNYPQYNQRPAVETKFSAACHYYRLRPLRSSLLGNRSAV
jgi:hypothetical protein